MNAVHFPIRVGPIRVGPIRVGPIRVGPIRVGPIRVGPIRFGAAAAAFLTLAACAGPYRDGGPYPRPDYRTHPPAGAAHVTPPPRACPPGLAKKGSCIPPGQRKHWQRGDVVPDTVRVRVLTRYRDRGYRAPPRGQVYIEIDGGIYLMAQATRRIVRVMLAAN